MNKMWLLLGGKMTKLDKINEIMDFLGIKLYSYQKVLTSLRFTQKEIDKQYDKILKIRELFQ